MCENYGAHAAAVFDSYTASVCYYLKYVVRSFFLQNNTEKDAIILHC